MSLRRESKVAVGYMQIIYGVLILGLAALIRFVPEMAFGISLALGGTAVLFGLSKVIDLEF